MDSGWAGDKLLGCESPQWVCRLSIDLSRDSYNPSKLLIASHPDYWLKYEGGILEESSVWHPPLLVKLQAVGPY